MLQLKQIASYLPYGLKWEFEGEDFTYEVVGLDITNKGIKLESPYYDYGFCSLDKGSPILRPLTDLCTKLPNGKIPAVEMAKLDLIYKKHLDRTLLVDDNWEPIFEYRIIEKPFGKVLKVTSADTWIIYLSFTKISNIPHFLFEYLLENHFDVFGLIEQ